MIDVERIRKDFPVYSKQPRLTYLDSAASSLKLNTSLDAMINYYEKSGANISRGAYALGIETTQAYEASRDTVASFINASKREEVIFIR